MKKHTFNIYQLRKEKKIDYSNYHFALALYNIYKNESRKEAKLPVDDFRNRGLQKQSGTIKLKQKLGRYILTIIKDIKSNVFIGKENPTFADQQKRKLNLFKQFSSFLNIAEVISKQI